jgi:hypothetical protein
MQQTPLAPPPNKAGFTSLSDEIPRPFALRLRGELAGWLEGDLGPGRAGSKSGAARTIIGLTAWRRCIVS